LPGAHPLLQLFFPLPMINI